MADLDLLYTPAVELAGRIRRKELSPVELVDAVLARIEATQPTINAFITETAETARTEAKAAEQAVMADRPLGPLHGIPFSVKDLTPTAGVRTTMGSAIFADQVPAAIISLSAFSRLSAALA
jgi:aspartyl-tRNA(Asn)/glutamyl-tRNA(Gln) amidotransferase subunit A